MRADVSACAFGCDNTCRETLLLRGHELRLVMSWTLHVDLNHQPGRAPGLHLYLDFKAPTPTLTPTRSAPLAVGLFMVGLLLPLRRPRCRCSARAALSGDSLRAHLAGSPRPEPDRSESAVGAPSDSLSVTESFRC